MKKSEFYITDVFADKKYSGNQLATFLNCSDLSVEEMQQIAREINFSETTFVTSNKLNKGGYDVRIFTPESEIDFAGHPTLGTAYVINKHLLKKPKNKIILNLRVGQIPVSFNKNGLLWMEQKEPTFGKKIALKTAARMLSLPEAAIDSRFPVQEVSTGLPHLIISLKSLKYLKNASISKDDYCNFVAGSLARNILVFSVDKSSKLHDLRVRVFADYYGVPEDPATGSGNGCLAGYLIKHGYFKSNEINIKTGQGHEIGRPSLLFLKAKTDRDSIKITVGGKVIPVACGEWVWGSHLR